MAGQSKDFKVIKISEAKRGQMLLLYYILAAMPEQTAANTRDVNYNDYIYKINKNYNLKYGIAVEKEEAGKSEFAKSGFIFDNRTSAEEFAYTLQRNTVTPMCLDEIISELDLSEEMMTA